MSIDFKDFQNYYFDKIEPKLRFNLESSFTGKMSAEEIVGATVGNCLGADVSILSHYHKWLTENYNITPKS